MTDIRISVKNTAADGGTFTTPFWFGLHDGTFDLFDNGQAASAGLEAMAEDGDAAGLGAELTAADADGQSGLVAGAAGPIAPGEQTASIVDVDGAATGSISLVAMLLPSNDAFVGTGESIELFNGAGRFLGAQLVTFPGTAVYDAGTEVNTELDAAFLNQTAPDTGVDENGVVHIHPGFNGSVGNPTGSGDQNILGGTNAFGVPIDVEAADFTLPGAQIATVHINSVSQHTGTGRSELLKGSASDDIVHARGGNDFVLGKSGWDDLNGGNGRDVLLAGRGDDILNGGRGTDILRGGIGDDNLTGGKGWDALFGGRGADIFNFAAGDGRDTIIGFRGNDLIHLDIDGIGAFSDVLDAAVDRGRGTRLDFGDDGSILLVGVSSSELTEDQFAFA